MRILLNGLCLALALLLGSLPAAWADLTVCSAGCKVSSIIDSNRTWKKGTYQVREHIQVREGVTLTLDPGVMLKFSPGVNLQVAGTLIAWGTWELPIIFTSSQASPAPGDWGTILFTETAIGASFDVEGNYISGSIFEHCVVKYGGWGTVGERGAIWAKSPRVPFVYRSAIRSNAASGVLFVGPNPLDNEGIQEARVRESTISENHAGDSDGGGISVFSSGTAIISDNTLSGNTAGHNGGGILVFSRSGTDTLLDNTVSGNHADGWGGGIYVSSSGTATLSGNIISSNIISGNSPFIDYGHGGGIYVEVSSSSGTVTLSDNTISNNIVRGNFGKGGGVYLFSSGTATLSSNTISKNRAGSGGGIYVESWDTAILSGNTISGNSALYGGSGIYVYSGTVTIRENMVLYNTASWWNGGGIDVAVQGQPTLSHNDLLGNSPIQLRSLNASVGSLNIDARDNWWGTLNEREIGQGIWDKNDDSYLRVVDWQPYLTTPAFSNHPPSPPVSPSPDNGASVVVRVPTLRWSASTDPDPGDTVSYDVYLGTAADPPLVSEGQSSPSYTSHFLLKPYTTYSWRIVARDSQGAESSGPLWSFTTGSKPGPVLDPIGNKTVNEGQTLSFTISGSHPDGAPLTFSALGLPPGASFDLATRHFSWTLT